MSIQQRISNWWYNRPHFASLGQAIEFLNSFYSTPELAEYLLLKGCRSDPELWYARTTSCPLALFLSYTTGTRVSVNGHTIASTLELFPTPSFLGKFIGQVDQGNFPALALPLP